MIGAWINDAIHITWRDPLCIRLEVGPRKSEAREEWKRWGVGSRTRVPTRPSTGIFRTVSHLPSKRRRLVSLNGATDTRKGWYCTTKRHSCHSSLSRKNNFLFLVKSHLPRISTVCYIHCCNFFFFIFHFTHSLLFSLFRNIFFNFFVNWILFILFHHMYHFFIYIF